MPVIGELSRLRGFSLIYLQVRDVIENGPGLHVLSPDFNEVIIDRVQEQRQRLEEHQYRHYVVNFVDCMSLIRRQRNKMFQKSRSRGL